MTTRRTVVGLPVVLATVYARSVLAQDTLPSGSGCASLAPSGWRTRHDPDGLLCPEDGDTLRRPHDSPP